MLALLTRLNTTKYWRLLTLALLMLDCLGSFCRFCNGHEISDLYQADPPDVNRIPKGEVLGVTVILLTCSYKGQEFIRVG